MTAVTVLRTDITGKCFTTLAAVEVTADYNRFGLSGKVTTVTYGSGAGGSSTGDGGIPVNESGERGELGGQHQSRMSDLLLPPGFVHEHPLETEVPWTILLVVQYRDCGVRGASGEDLTVNVQLYPLHSLQTGANVSLIQQGPCGGSHG